MRTARLIILILFLAASLFVFCRAIASTIRATATSNFVARPYIKKQDKYVWGFMYYNTPFSLFPPNAAISLTDDNSTSFAARPAAFGPKLRAHGLSGQLWVGKGFPEDVWDGEGELGCSDLPGWDRSINKRRLKDSIRVPATKSHSHNGEEKSSEDRDGDSESKTPFMDDGTDAYLAGELSMSTSRYIDAEALRESADIEGKIVLLMRGGCAFLEKVLWAQRRGAVAVIVGDNQKGGPLIQMFAHGEEVDNITIPSVFTASTTAHLLSTLTQPGAFLEDSIDQNGNPVLRVQRGRHRSGKKEEKEGHLYSRTSQRSKAGHWMQKRALRSIPATKRINSKEWITRSLTWLNIQNNAIVKKEAHEYDTHNSRRKHRKDKHRIKTEHGSSSRTKFDIWDDEEDDIPAEPGNPDGEPREGLWVTITPTSSASPFFDTLLVLVISPLVTLTVVYALLILRARIRRRRWRAPKSVVERLPVRTYHTVAPSPVATRQPSPSSATPTTPLLQRSPSASRPRSRTTTGVLEGEDTRMSRSPIATPHVGHRSKKSEPEKGAGGFSAEWRKHMGRQVECVVCLEEYVDGVSKVMSLPCGHEFHVDCM